MLRLTDAERGLVTLSGRERVAAWSETLGDLLAVDTVRRVGSVLRLPLVVVGVSSGWESFNVHPSHRPGRADVVLHRPLSPSIPPYDDPLVSRFAWLAGTSVDEGELSAWRAQVAVWAEEPSKPICAQVQEDLLGALCDDLATLRAVEVLRASTSLGLPDGCLFETWAWADRLLGLDLARDVGR